MVARAKQFNWIGLRVKLFLLDCLKSDRCEAATVRLQVKLLGQLTYKYIGVGSLLHLPFLPDVEKIE